jgi:hypothetical protein
MLEWKRIYNGILKGVTRLQAGDVLLVESIDGNAANSRAPRIENNGQSIVRGLPILAQGAPAAKTTSTTLTAAELLGKIITGNQGAAGSAAYTLPLATSLDAAMPPGFAVGDSFDFNLVNISTVAAETNVMTTNTGWTLVGNMTVSANNAVTTQSQGTFRARKTGVAAWTLYRIG